MTQHTLESWRMHEANHTDLISVRLEDGSFVCQMCEPNAKEHARLIAAAPETAAERDRLKAINAELLTALEACSTWFAEAPIAELEAVEQAIGTNAPVALIHAAIAKAGED